MSIRPISEALQKKAIEELHEVPSRIQADIKYIREWIVQEAHLAHIKIEDQKILNFLRGCKFSLQKTKEKIDMFYTMKSLLPEFYSNRDPFRPEIQQILNYAVCLPLFKTTAKDGPMVILLRFNPSEPTRELFINNFKIGIMIIDILLQEHDNTVISEKHMFTDCEELNIKHFLTMDVNIFRKAIICLERAYPLRPKAVHYLNAPGFIEKFLIIMKSVLSEKLKRRIFVHTDQNSGDIFKTIPRSILPKDYGGDGESVEQLGAYWKKKVEDYREWFLEDEKDRSDESKRVGFPKTSAELFGMEGSFRKLEVD